MITIDKLAHFENGTEALVAIKQMSPSQKERMLMDLVWKQFERPKGLSVHQLVNQAYNIAVLVKE